MAVCNSDYTVSNVDKQSRVWHTVWLSFWINLIFKHCSVFQANCFSYSFHKLFHELRVSAMFILLCVLSVPHCLLQLMQHKHLVNSSSVSLLCIKRKTGWHNHLHLILFILCLVIVINYIYKQMHIQYVKEHKLFVHISSPTCFCKSLSTSGRWWHQGIYTYIKLDHRKL
jgi:hypothetical protein